MEIKLDFGLILAVYSLLLLFGCGYNALIGWAERKGFLEGYTALAVVAGTLVTVGLTALVHWQFALVTLGAFAASGLPMVAGSIWRHVTARKEGQDDERQAATLA